MDSITYDGIEEAKCILAEIVDANYIKNMKEEET